VIKHAHQMLPSLTPNSASGGKHSQKAEQSQTISRAST
jgi:hypothetical protein